MIYIAPKSQKRIWLIVLALGMATRGQDRLTENSGSSTEVLMKTVFDACDERGRLIAQFLQ